MVFQFVQILGSGIESSSGAGFLGRSSCFQGFGVVQSDRLRRDPPFSTKAQLDKKFSLGPYKVVGMG